MQEAVLIGDENTRENYYPAIVECDETTGTVTYDYDLLVECFEKEMLDEEDPTLAATEWVDYNVIRGIPYYGPHRPKVRAYDFENEKFFLLTEED